MVDETTDCNNCEISVNLQKADKEKIEDGVMAYICPSCGKDTGERLFYPVD